MLRRLSLTTALLALASAPALAGPVLDDIMNTMKLGAHTSGPDMDKWRTVEPGRPIGQTFVTGDDVCRIDRICISAAYWNEDWQPGESLVLTLWDSPEKKRQLGRDAIPYERRQWEGAVLIYRLDAAAKSRTRCYYELAVEGGDGKIVGVFLANREYPDGRAYESGVPQDYDFHFEVNVKTHADLDALYQEQFDKLDLDHPGLEKVKVAVGRRDWESACRWLVAHFEGRADLVDPGRTVCRKNPDFDPTVADLAVDHKHLDHGEIIDLGPDWNYLVTWPLRGGVGLTRSGLRKYLAAGYSQTCDQKYAVAFNDMMESFFRNFPSPIKSGVISGRDRIGPTFPSGIAGGSMWASLSIAARNGHGFYYYTTFVRSPHFTLDTRAAWIFNMVDQANVLELMDAGGNWQTQNTMALAEFGLTYPEFAKSKQWVAQGREGLVKNFFDTVRPDGTLGEASVSYTMLCMNRYLWMLEQPPEAGLDPPAEMRDRLEKMCEYIMYSTLPDWTLPAWGDSSWADPQDVLRRAAKVYGRDDFLWVATRGKEGTPPAKTSVAFPDGGYFVMRGGWRGPTAVVHNAYSGSHGHRDANSIVIGIFDNQVVTDPGIWVYGTPESAELTATRSHPTMTVDGRDTKNGDYRNRWTSLSKFDYLDATNGGFVGSDVIHRRRVVFIKPYTWVICDQVKGSGEHQFDIRFPLDDASVADNGRGPPVSVVMLENGTVVFPLDMTSAACLQPADAPGLEHRIDRGVTAQQQVNGKLRAIPVARYSRRATAGDRFATMFVTSVATLWGRPAALLDEPGAVGYRLKGILSDALVRFADPSTGPTPDTGECQVITHRLPKDGKPQLTSLFWVDGRIARDGDRIIVDSEKPIAALQVRYDADTLSVDAEGQDPTLRVWTQGAKSLIVNGGEPRELAAGAEYVSPFAQQ